MQLPVELRERIETFLEGIPLKTLARAVARMSEGYRAGRSTRDLPLNGRERAAAYLATRFPATYAAAFHVLQEVSRRLAGSALKTHLDIGAGTGAVALAARNVFGDLKTRFLVEPDGALRTVAAELLPEAVWCEADLAKHDPPAADLVSLGYVLGEVSPALRRALLASAWKAALQALVVLEPGTPAGFSIILETRTWLLREGARMVAPCPSESPCPAPANDWCHFGQRLERTALQRRLKDASLGYEDEKFSYIAVARGPVCLAKERIIRRPVQRPGVIELEVCRGDSFAVRRISKRERELFRSARRSRWGDSFPPD